MLTTLCSVLTGTADEQRLTQAFQEWLVAQTVNEEHDHGGAKDGLRLGGEHTLTGPRAPSSNAAVLCTTPVAAATRRGGKHKAGHEDCPELVYDSDDEDADDDSDSDSNDEYVAPHFPCAATLPSKRRDRHRPGRLYNACVARPIKPAELKVNQEARDKMQEEWDRLRRVKRPDGTHGVWDEDAVEEWSKVRKRARRTGATVNVGLVFGIVVEKNHELPENAE